MTIKEFVKEFRDEVVIPSMFGCAIIYTTVVGSALFADYVGRTIGVQSPWTWTGDPYGNASVRYIDTDGDGKFDTRITVIPRAGTLREKINPF